MTVAFAKDCLLAVNFDARAGKLARGWVDAGALGHLGDGRAARGAAIVRALVPVAQVCARARARVCRVTNDQAW